MGGLMLKISTKVRYGIRAMLDLAMHYGNRPVLLKDISHRQGLSLKYLDRILVALKVVGLVKSLRGAKGGYVLNEKPAKITMYQILKALEGPIELVGCVSNKSYCHKNGSCVMHDIWNELGRAMEGTLKSTSLEDLIIRERKKNRNSERMYYI
jgi:Rrf2 family transcriptional regulator, cysteine metabolism repressor